MLLKIRPGWSISCLFTLKLKRLRLKQQPKQLVKDQELKLILRKLDGEDVDDGIVEAGITDDEIERIATRKRMHQHKVCYPPIFEARSIIKE